MSDSSRFFSRFACISLALWSSGGMAADPLWWSTGSPPVITPSAPGSVNNLSVATVGQAKWMAKCALDAVTSVNPGLGALISSDLVGTGKAIPNWNAPVSDDEKSAQRSALLIGQLKAIAAPFYNRCNVVAPDWLAGERATNLTESGGVYPWTDDPADDTNSAPATIGQIKAVFALRFETLVVTRADTDGDGLPDDWEIAHGTNPNVNDAGGAFNGGSSTNLQAFQAGVQSIAAATLEDRDGDGVPDKYDADPTNRHIDWMATSKPLFALDEIELDDVENVTLNDLTASGTILLTRNNEERTRILVPQAGDPVTFTNDSTPVDGDFVGYSPTLIGEKVPGFRLVGGVSQECLWTPPDDFTAWTSPVNYHYELYDDRDGVTVGRFWMGAPDFGLHDSPGGASMPGEPDLGSASAQIEQNGNVMSDKAYWRKNAGGTTFAQPTTLPEDRSWMASASIDQTVAGNHHTWNLVVGIGGLLISKDGGAFFNLQGDFDEGVCDGVTTQGWVYKYLTSQIWGNGHWYKLKDCLGDPTITNASILRIMDTGLAVAVIERGSGPATLARLVPVVVDELAPKVLDEHLVEVAGSERPSTGLPLSPFVELNPATDKIAHRELKVKLSKALAGKTITWTQTVVPGATPATIRGSWTNAIAAHQNKFEASATYGAHGFTALSDSGRTTVDADGFTAIRVNVPPIGFNQVRIKVQIEGTTTPLNLIDMEVPAAVVIDPGHGGKPADAPPDGSSSWNNAVSPSGVLEKTMTLNYGLALRDALLAKRTQDKLNLRVFMTRDTDVNPSGGVRANMARDNGADVIFVLHFNSNDDTHQSRGTLEVYRNSNNVSQQEDTDLSSALIDGVVAALTPFDAAVNHRPRYNYEEKKKMGPAVSSDINNGNTASYHPVRTAYLEGEFIDFGANTPSNPADDAVDILMNTGPNAAAVKTAFVGAVRDGILRNIRNYTDPAP